LPTKKVVHSCNKIKRGLQCGFESYSMPTIIRVMKSKRMRGVAHVTCMGEKRNAYRVLVGKPEGKTPLERPRHRLVHNIRNGS
jgi:hypothetical protein